MNTSLRILHLEDNPADAALVSALLLEEWPGCEVRLTTNRDEFVRAVGARPPHDVVLSDFTLNSFDGLEALALARQALPEVPFIFLSGTIGEDRALEAVHAGAQDYVLKDRLKRLVPAIRRALRETEERSQRQAAEATLHRFAALLESSPDFVGMASVAGKIFYINQAGLTMLGRPAGYDPGLMSLQDCHPPAIRERLEREIIPAALQSGSWVGESVLLGPD